MRSANEIGRFLKCCDLRPRSAKFFGRRRHGAGENPRLRTHSLRDTKWIRQAQRRKLGASGQGPDMNANLEERDVGGYSVAYRRDDTNFPVYVTAALAAVFVTAAWITGEAYWLAFSFAAAGFTYYNMPLLETGRPTIGANQYGIFIQAFGLIRWRAIERIDLVQIADRAMTPHELQIVLNAPLKTALFVTGPKQLTYLFLIRLPLRIDTL